MSLSTTFVAHAEAPISEASDWTCRVLADGLQPSRIYWYRFTDASGYGSRVAGPTQRQPMTIADLFGLPSSLARTPVSQLYGKLGPESLYPAESRGATRWIQIRGDSGPRGTWTAILLILFHSMTCVDHGKEHARAEGHQHCHVQSSAPALVHGDRCGHGG
jgi:hypothetical protein